MPFPFWQQDPQEAPAPQPTFWTSPPPAPDPEPVVPFWAGDDVDNGITIEALAPNGFAMPDLDDESPDFLDVLIGDVSIDDVASIFHISGLDPDGEDIEGPFEDDGNALLFVTPRIDTQAELEALADLPPGFFFFRRPEEGDDILDPFDTSILLFEGLLDADDFAPSGDLDEPFADNLKLIDDPFGEVFGPNVLFEVPESGEVTVVVMDGFFDPGSGEDNTGDGLIDFSLGIIHEDTLDEDSDIYFELGPDVANVFWGAQEDPFVIID